MDKKTFKKKLIIGTANFTQKYGAVSTKINRNEIKKIFKYAKENYISMLDSADTYYTPHTFNREKDVFKRINKKFKFIAKIKPDQNWASPEYCKKKLDSYFKIFNGNKVETLIIHDEKILFKKIGYKVFQNLENLKNVNYFKKIGLSIYNTNTLSHLMPHYDFDVIQCPYNILDRRIISSGWYDKLKKKGIEIHVRSIFLQGLLVNPSAFKKKHFKRWEFFFSKWFEALYGNKISPIDYCLSDLLEYNFDRIIIGINSCDNLKDIVNFKIIKNKDKSLIFKTKINSLNLLDPRKWK